MSAGLECIGKVVFGRLSEDFAAAAELLVRLRVPARLRIALVARLRLLVAALRDMRGGTHICICRKENLLVLSLLGFRTRRYSGDDHLKQRLD